MQVQVGVKLCILMPEDGRRPKHVTRSVGFNKLNLLLCLVVIG
jgi:hypothetical protein